jgi:hypothetical protein
MRRWHQEEAIARRHHREHLRFVHGWPQQPVECVCDLRAGRFRKRYGRGCPGCRMCHSEKYAGIPRRRDACKEMDYRQQLEELHAVSAG